MDKPHHIGHRGRLRERFRSTGFKGFKNYEALELLLSYAIPRIDVKPLAKTLIKRFGSFKGVMDATYEQLLEVEGIRENTATFVLAMKEASIFYLQERMKHGGPRKKLSHTSDVLDYCYAAMGGLKDEQFRALFLNSVNEVTADEVIHEGTVNESVVYPRKLIERALYHKAVAMIIAHNHPSGNCKPSPSDEMLTFQLVKLARELGLTVHDHLIISDNDYFSFAESGLMRLMQRQDPARVAEGDAEAQGEPSDQGP